MTIYEWPCGCTEHVEALNRWRFPQRGTSPWDRWLGDHRNDLPSEYVVEKWAALEQYV